MRLSPLRPLLFAPVHKPGRGLVLTTASFHVAQALEVENLTLLPDIVVATFDVNGNLTGPERGENWAIRVEGEGLEDRESAAKSSQAVRKVDSQGTCTIRGVKVGS